jgi:hypothetical protein
MTDDFLDPIPIEEADPVDRLMLADGDDRERPELDLAVYRDLVNDLPPPTDKQIRAFAEYVSTAKSWYKHLPLGPPGRRFRFFLHPYAGFSRLLLVDGRTLFAERTDDDPGCHYSWRATELYRESFGHLAFYGPAGSGMFIRILADGADGVLDCNPSLALIQTNPKEAYRPPSEVLDVGSCSVTAFLHPGLDEVRDMAGWLVKGASGAEPMENDPTWNAIVENCRLLAECEASPAEYSENAIRERLAELAEQRRSSHISEMVAAMQRVRGLIFDGS